MKKLLPLLFALLLFSCSSDDKLLAGASTVETENACIINVVDADSVPVANAVAKVRPLWYVQDVDASNENLQVVAEYAADSLGRVVLDSLEMEKGYLEITKDGAGAFAQIVKADLKKQGLTLQMETLGSASGKVDLPENAEFAWVQVYGTDKLVKTDSSGAFVLDSLPPASYQVRAIVSNDEPAVGEDFVQITADAKNEIGFLSAPSAVDENLESWRYFRTIPLEATVSDWMLPIADSTVVFVRLDSSNFAFESAMKHGEDVRFTDLNGNRLEFLRSYWNDSLQNAEFKIRVNGVAEVDSIVMYWGRAAATDASCDSIWKNLPDSLVQNLNSLKVIDFEKQKLETAFAYVGGPREWYFEPQDSNVTTIPTLENVEDGFEKSDERGGYVFHWKGISEKKDKWSMIGMRLNQVSSNFEGLDSIAFYAKGSGELGFALEVLDEPTGKTKYVDSLAAEWRRYSFTPADFAPGDGKYGNMGWDFVKPRVTTVTIWVVANGEMWIDDVVFYGINRDDVN